MQKQHCLNPTMVRLKDDLNYIKLVYRYWSQSHYGSIKRMMGVTSIVAAAESLNPTMVRLKEK